MVRFAPAFCLSLLVLCAGASAASAGGFSVGSVGKVPVVGGFQQNRIVTPGAGGMLSGAGGGINVSNADGVSVQTNINAARNVQAGSNVSVNETVNGVPVGYGGADFLAGADAQGQDAWAQRQAYIQQLQTEAQMYVQIWQAQGNQGMAP